MVHVLIKHSDEMPESIKKLGPLEDLLASAAYLPQFEMFPKFSHALQFNRDKMQSQVAHKQSNGSSTRDKAKYLAFCTTHAHTHVHTHFPAILVQYLRPVSAGRESLTGHFSL